MLTVTLHSLKADGLIIRTVYAEVPLRVEYQLTELVQSLLALTIALGAWAMLHTPAIAENRGRMVV